MLATTLKDQIALLGIEPKPSTCKEEILPLEHRAKIGLTGFEPMLKASEAFVLVQLHYSPIKF